MTGCDMAGCDMAGCDMAGLFHGPGVTWPAREPAIAAASPRGLGRAMAGGGGKVERQGNDYYPTPPACTRALVEAEMVPLRAYSGALAGARALPIWEPCGRGGAIAAVLVEHGFATIASDLIADPDHGVRDANLLAITRAWSPVVITNPPFALAEEMIRHLLGELQVEYLALLLKSTFWHAAGRTGLWRRHVPARVWALNWRPDFMRLGAPTMECIWTVWDGQTVEGDTRYGVMAPARPTGLFG